jgi:cobalt-zinc-cadmium efflux system protein
LSTAVTTNHAHHAGEAPDCEHPGEPDRAKEKRGLVVALALQSVIMVAEFVGGRLTGSLALTADAGHMLTDVSALALSLLAFSFASRPPDPRRTYGYHRLEILAALANGVILTGLAILIIYEAVNRLGAPAPVRSLEMLAFAAVGLIANLIALRILMHKNATLNLRGAFLHVVSDTLGSVGVIIGAVIIHFTGALVTDPIISIVIACAIVFAAFRLLRDSVDVLLEACPADIQADDVRRAIKTVAGVVEVHDLHIWTITSGMYALSAHVVVDAHRVHSNNALLERLRELLATGHRITHTTLQIESSGYEHAGEVH